MRKQNSVKLSLFFCFFCDILCFRKECDIEALRLQWYSIRPESSQRSHSERANTTRREPNITAYTMQLCAISLATGE